MSRAAGSDRNRSEPASPQQRLFPRATEHDPTSSDERPPGPHGKAAWPFAAVSAEPASVARMRGDSGTVLHGGGLFAAAVSTEPAVFAWFHRSPELPRFRLGSGVLEHVARLADLHRVDGHARVAARSCNRAVVAPPDAFP